jgi:hypothetical protein
MNTAILTVVLTGALLAGQNGTPIWQNDYIKAQAEAAIQKKPLVVVFGSGAGGWVKVVREAPTTDLIKLLADKYVCVFVDTASPAGRKLAQDFDITGNLGLVISDQAGTSQAFWHQGDLTTLALIHYLEKYSDPRVAVRGTETVNMLRTSFYPPDASQGNTPAIGSMRSRSC